MVNALPAILVCDRDSAFREALRNFLFAAGYAGVEVVATVRDALAMLRHRHYRCILVGLSRPLSTARRLASVARQRQPGAQVLFLVGAADAPLVRDTSLVYVIKEHAFPILLDVLARNGDDISSSTTIVI